MALFTLKTQAFKFDTYSDLVGKRGGAQRAIALAKPLIVTREQSPSWSDAITLHSNFQKLLAERIDFVVTGLYTGRAQLLREGLADRIGPRLARQRRLHPPRFCAAQPCISLLEAVDARPAAARKSGLDRRLLEEALQEWQQRQPAPRPLTTRS